MGKHQLNIARFSLYLSSAWLIFIFIFLPHYVELTGVLETWLLHKGLIYYKDFAAYHFPIGRLVLLPIHLLSNWNLELDPWVALLVGASTLYILYLFCKRFLSAAGTAISLLFFAIFFWYAATGVLFFHEILIGFLLALIIYILFELHNAKAISKASLFFLGVLISLTELSGQIATITLGVAFLVVIYEIAKKQPKKIIISIGLLLAGIILPFLLFSLYFFLNDALWEFYHYNISYYRLYAGYGKSKLLSLPLGDLLAFYMPLILLLLTTLLAGVKRNDYKVIYAIFLSISTIPFIFFSIYHPHHLNYALPVLAITGGVAYDKSVGKRPLFLLGGVIALFIIATSILPWHITRIKYPPSFRISNDIYQDSKDPMKSAVDWLKTNTPKTARIMVMSDPLFYLRSDRLPAARPSKGMPYGWNPMSQIEKELVAKRPEYWIVSERFLERMNSYYDRKDIYDFMNRELASCFKVVAVFEEFKIWQKSCP